MRIGLLFPSIYASEKTFPGRIFAPRDLCVSLADGLVRRGHEVTVFGVPDLKTRAKVVETSLDYVRGKLAYAKMKNRLERQEYVLVNREVAKRAFEVQTISNAFSYAEKGKLDLIHCYHDSMLFLTHYFAKFSFVPVVYTLHDPLPPKGSFEEREFQAFRRDSYFSISRSQRKSHLRLNFRATIYHGIPVERFSFSGSVKEDGPLVFMGRMVPEKGVDVAISAARSLGKLLYVASGKNSGDEAYYRAKVRPFLKRGSVEETGFLRFQERNKYLAKARALLFPIQWAEPFGMVMAEAMACGTPVVAFDEGSVSEVVRDGVTGFTVSRSAGKTGFLKAVKRMYEMPEVEYRKMREACRAHVEKHFSEERMVEGHEVVYNRMIKDLL